MSEKIKEITMPSSKFLKVKCNKCNNEQIIFNKTSNEVKCLVCGTVLASPTGGKAEILTKVLHSVD